MNSLSFGEFTLIWLWINYLFANSLYFDYEFTISLQILYDLTIHSFSFGEFTMIWLWIHFFSRVHSDLIMIPLSFSRFDYEFPFFREVTMIRQLVHYLFASSLWFDYDFTNGFANSLWIFYIFSKFTMNSLSYRELSMNWLWIHYPFRNFTMN